MSPAEPKVFRGIPAGPGYSIGHVFMIPRESLSIPTRQLRPNQVDPELARFDDALDEAITDLDAMLQRMKHTAAEGTLILEAHRLILQDEMLVERTRDVIRNERLNAEAALDQTLSSLEEAFASLEESYFKERGADLRFAGSRVLTKLMGTTHRRTASIPPGAVVVAHELSPAQALELTARRINGFVTEVGGRASHTTILARAMETPAVVGAAGILESALNGQSIVIDGTSGLVILNPDKETIARFRSDRRLYRARQAELLSMREAPAETRDGVSVTLAGNIEYLAEIDSLLSHGGRGIGLYRTEYLFLRGEGAPDEETQYEEYRRIVEEIAPLPATMRTLDVGADKPVEGVRALENEDNPALGLRGVRLTLRHIGLMRAQLRALLRASAHGSLRLLIPFVNSMAEVRAVRALVEETKAGLERDGLAYDPEVQLGIMIEVPSAAIIADHLAREVDFFSIGTNDLTQYTTAVDRNNPHVAPLYRPHHPAVLSLIATTVRAADQAGIPCAICGEMAGEAISVPMLLGCGLRELSMNPISIPLVKDLIRRCTMADCQALAAEVLALGTVDEVEKRLLEFHQKLTAP